MKMTQSKSHYSLSSLASFLPHLTLCTLVQTENLHFVAYLMLILLSLYCGFSLSGAFLEAKELFVLCGLSYRLQLLREESEEDSRESKNAE